MKKWIFTSFKMISLILIGFVVGTYIGFKFGFEAYPLLDGVPRGSLAVIQLKALNANNQKPARLYLETDVNQSLYMYSLLHENRLYSHTIMYLAGESPSEYVGYVKRVADYRAKNPDSSFDSSPLESITNPNDYKNIEDYKNLAEAQRDRIARIQEVIRTHSGS